MTAHQQPPHHGRIAEWVFDLLVRAFPRHFREQFGAEMRELFKEQLRTASEESGMRGAIGLCMHTTPRMLAAALLERRDSLVAWRARRALPRPTRARGDGMLASLTTDLRFAGRMLRKSPVFTIVAAACISIGSGAMATIFSAMNSLVLRPLPGASDAARLVRIERKRPGGRDGVSASYPLYQLLRSRTHTLSGIATWGKAALTLRAGQGEGVAIYGNFVSGNFFDVLGVRPDVGRFFAADEDSVELAHSVIVVSNAFWRAYLGADPTAVGREITVNGFRYTLIGVTPATFQGVDAPIQTDAWIPLAMQRQLRPTSGPLGDRNVTWLRLCARLAPDVSPDAAHRELAALTASYIADAGEPAVYRQYSDMQITQLTGLPVDASRPLAIFLSLLLGAAGLVLLIASVNVASMLSARAIARQREMAVRAALGAARSRLVRQLLTEILVLFALGAAGGMVIAVFATAAFEHMSIPFALPFALELSPDWRVFTFALGVSLATGLLFGLAPALRAVGRDIATRMRDGSLGSGTRRTWGSNALVVGQLALSLVLLISAGLFLQGLQRASQADPGFDASGVATLALNTEQWGYDDAKGRAFFARLRDEIETLPGVVAVSSAMFAPLTMQSQEANVDVSGGDGRDESSGTHVGFLKVDADYFSVIRMPLVAGRGIERTDDARSPRVAVVNETFARRYWPDGSAVGRTIGFRGSRVSIVGVARDAKYSTLTETTPAFAYFPLAQQWEPRQMFLVRTVGDPLSLAPAIDRTLHAIDPGLPRAAVSTLRRDNGFVLIPQRVAAIVIGALGAVGLLLATVGLYGIMAYSSSRRRREIGIRMALGARSADVLGMIVRDGMRLALSGVFAGLTLATFATRLLTRYLFGVSPLDGATFAFMALLFAAVALVASYLPARRAASANPMRVLREE